MSLAALRVSWLMSAWKIFSTLTLNFQSHTLVIYGKSTFLHQIHKIRANITGQSIQIGMSDDDFHYCPWISFVIFLAHCILRTYHKVLKVCLRRARKNTWSQATYRKSQIKIKHFFKSFILSRNKCLFIVWSMNVYMHATWRKFLFLLFCQFMLSLLVILIDQF